MKSTLLLSSILLGLAGVANAADVPPAADAAPAADAPPEADAASAVVDVPAMGSDDMCFYTNALPHALQYTVVAGKLKVSKGTYGSVREMLPRLAAQARAAGGDAVINYNGGQRFGFWPWRMTHPVVTGGALKWSAGQAAPDCEATGGELMSRIIASDKAPPHDPK